MKLLVCQFVSPGLFSSFLGEQGNEAYYEALNKN